MRDGTQLHLPVAENYRDCLTLIRSDIFRRNGKKVTGFNILIKAVFHPYRDFMIWFRLCQHRGILYPLTAAMYRKCQTIHQIRIPLKTRIGYGCYLGHHMCIVIHGGTVIGNNVNLSQFLNIGSNRNTPAVIGNEVYIGPMTCLVEDVQIGSNSTVGAGAVVTKDVAGSTVVAGVPAKLIREGGSKPQHCWETAPVQD